MADITDELNGLHFAEKYYVQGRASIADLFKPGKRCGIYILHFLNGEFYAGQAVDVVRRYTQHCKTHSDIAEISFKQVEPSCLNTAEREVIESLDRAGLKLRNITFVCLPPAESDFDLIMPRKKQEHWLSNLEQIDLVGERSADPDLRRRYHKRYERFQSFLHADDVISVLREYVHASIPAIKQGEPSFWSCSCLPPHPDRRVKVYSRINVNWQEVFTAATVDGKLGFSWHLALSPLEKKFGSSLHKLESRFPGLFISDHRYVPGGVDQINIEIEDVGTALKIIHDHDVLYAIRLFNLRLMNKGTCTFNRYHCFDLADSLVE